MSSKEHQIIEVQIDSDAQHWLSEREKTAISTELTNELTIQWRADRRSFIGQRAGDAIQTAILAFLGATAASLVMKFLEGAVDEAGKSLWKGILSLAKTVWTKKLPNSYRLYSRIWVILPVEETLVCIRLNLPPFDVMEHIPIDVVKRHIQLDLPIYDAVKYLPIDVEQDLNRQLSEIAGQWDAIKQSIDEHRRLAKEREHKIAILVIQNEGDKDYVVLVEPYDYFEGDPEGPRRSWISSKE